MPKAKVTFKNLQFKDIVYTVHWYQDTFGRWHISYSDPLFDVD